MPSLGEFTFKLLEVESGDSANELARESLGWPTYMEPIQNQEYLAVHGIMSIDRLEDNNEVQSLYPAWSLTLRYAADGPDTWSFLAATDLAAEGYPPIEADFWIFYLIRTGSSPLLYFQPWLSINERHGVRTSGAYFELTS